MKTRNYIHEFSKINCVAISKIPPPPKRGDLCYWHLGYFNLFPKRLQLIRSNLRGARRDTHLDEGAHARAA